MAPELKRTVVVLRERWWESMLNDSFCFSAMLLCFWITKESVVWSLVVAVLFSTWGLATFSDAKRLGVLHFKNVGEVFKWSGEQIIEELEKAKEVKE